jgi:hypothetical protein
MYFFKGAGQVKRGKFDLREDPQRQKLKLCFLVILDDMAAKIILRMLDDFKSAVFKYNLTTVFVEKLINPVIALHRHFRK